MPSAWSIRGASTAIATAAHGSVSAKPIGVAFSVIKVSENSNWIILWQSLN